MRFLTRSEVSQQFEGKRVALVGSGPGVLDNPIGLIDGYDIVVRVNNYRLSAPAGRRCDVHYSFYGTSIRKTREELIRDGVRLCMCKCPNSQPIESEWHRRNGKMEGVDFRWIYRNREAWWFCDTYIPEDEDFRRGFHLLSGHVPTTGFSAILDVLSFGPAELYLTGFDFFRSGLHNVSDPWRHKNSDDPIGHVPERELAWLAANFPIYPITADKSLFGHLSKVSRCHGRSLSHLLGISDRGQSQC